MITDGPDDTSPEARRVYIERLKALTGADRVAMTADMFRAARRLVEASLPALVRDDPRQLRVAVLRRFYGRDLDAATLEKVAAHLERVG